MKTTSNTKSSCFILSNAYDNDYEIVKFVLKSTTYVLHLDMSLSRQAYLNQNLKINPDILNTSDKAIRLDIFKVQNISGFI